MKFKKLQTIQRQESRLMCNASETSDLDCCCPQCMLTHLHPVPEYGPVVSSGQRSRMFLFFWVEAVSTPHHSPPLPRPQRPFSITVSFSVLQMRPASLSSHSGPGVDYWQFRMQRKGFMPALELGRWEQNHGGRLRNLTYLWKCWKGYYINSCVIVRFLRFWYL